MHEVEDPALKHFNGASRSVDEEGIIFQLADGTVVAGNAVAEKLLGLSTEQMRGWTWAHSPWQAIHEDGSEFPGETHPANIALLTGQPQFNVVMGLAGKDKDPLWLEIDAQPLFEAGSSTTYGVISKFRQILPSQFGQNRPQQKLGSDLSCCNQSKSEPNKAIALFNFSIELLAISSLMMQEIAERTEAEASLRESQGEEITERKQAESKLRYQQERLQTALLAAETGTFRWDIRTNALDWDENLDRLFGLPPGETARSLDAFIQMVHPADRQGVIERCQQCATEGADFEMDFRVVYPDGSIRWLSYKGKTFFDRAGKPAYMTGGCVDISDRKQAEAALRQSEEFKERMLESSPDCIKLLDLDGQLLYMNTGGMCVMEIDDITPFLNAQWVCFWQGEDREQAQQAFAIAKAGEVSIFRGYCPTAKGTPKWWEVIVSPILDAYGQVEQLLSISRDITERKQAEEALRRSEERYRILFESMEDGFCAIEVVFNQHNQPIDYRFIEINPAFELQTGLKQAEGKTARQLIPNLENYWFEIYGEVALTGEPVRFENFSERMNRWFDVYAFRIGQPESCKVAILFKDISDRKAIEAQREKLLQQEQAAREAAERTNRIKDEFLAVLSHELRSPLNPILGWAKLLQTGRISAAKTTEALAIIERNARLQSQLIEDLLDMSRILRGKLTLNVAPVALAATIKAALETVRLAAEAKNIQIQLSLLEVRPIMGDAGRLQQVIWNLLTNSIKFTPENGCVEVRLTQIESHIQIQVGDTGKGIAKEFLPYVFEHFRQEDSAITRKFGGLGLGLAIVRQIVEMHGGTVQADSPGEGQGATFTVNLPLPKQTLATPNQDAGSVSIAQSTPLAGIRVLVVDDDEDSRDFVAFVLKEAGAEVVSTSSAIEALQILPQSQFDIVVSDIGMPQIDGYTFMRQIRARPHEAGSQIPAIALTAYAGDFNQQQALQAGFQDHISKPVEPDALVKAIATLIASK